MNITKEYESVVKSIQSNTIKFLGWEKLKEKNIAVCADIHAPFHSDLWVYRFLATAKKRNTKPCIIGGDMFQFDEFSKHKSNNPDAKFVTSMLSFKKLMEAYFKVFKVIYISQGNHDDWLSIFTEGRIINEDMLKLFGEFNKEFKDKVVVSKYPYIELNDKWRITHAKSYSVTKGAVANKLSIKFNKNICNAHGHFLSFGYSVNGKNFVIDLGGLFDREKMYYVMFSDTTHPVWNNGFLVIEDDYPTLYGDHTNWKKEGIR